jgi:hypothetical protein
MTLSACTKAPGSPSASGTSTASSTAQATSARPSSASAKPTAKAGPPSLGGRCEDLLPTGRVNIALHRVVSGKTAFILGVPEADIGRLTYLNCRYGVPAAAKGKPAGDPLVEVGISLYNSSAQAARRVEGTVDDYRSHGARDSSTKVGQYRATVLSGYGSPTLVVAAGVRSIAVTVDARLIPKSPATGLASLAKAALDATAHFTPGSSAASSATKAPTATASSSTTS